MAFSLQAVFGVDSTGVRTELRQLRKEFNSFVGDYAKLGAGLAIGAFVALSKGALDLAATLKDTALQIGINVESLQALHYAATQNGSSIDSMNKALTKLRLGVREAFDGNKDLNAALATLGLTAQELMRLPLEKQYVRIGQALAQAADKSAAYNAVSKLFGEKIGPDQIKVLESLAKDGFEKAAKAAADAGQVMKAETIVALESASQAIEDFKKRATVAVGNILVNFRTEEGMKLMLYQFLRVVGVFGAKIVDAVVEAGATIKAVLWGELSWVVNKFRDAFLDSISFVATRLNKLLPDRFQINIAGIESLKSAGKDLGDTIIDAIAKTKPSTFAKDVADYWDRAIADQKAVVNELNRVDLGKGAKELVDAGKSIDSSASKAAVAIDDSAERFVAAGHTVGEAIAAGGVTFESSQRLWRESIADAKRVATQIGGLLAGIRGGSVFNELSDEALQEVVRQNRSKAAALLNPALTKSNIGADLDAARLQAEALNAQQELDIRNRFRTDVARLGVEGARGNFDPVVFEKLLQRFGPGASGERTNNLLASILEEQKRTSLSLREGLKSLI